MVEQNVLDYEEIHDWVLRVAVDLEKSREENKVILLFLDFCSLDHFFTP
jgi:hypothetical protein